MISVIIPLYNKETIIGRTLNSVILQDYGDFEVIIVDDGSTDNSLKVVEEYIEQLKTSKSHAQHIHIVRQHNGGPSAARNTGVRNAKGEWIVFLDADDELTEGALQYFSEIIKQYSDADIIDCGGYIRFGDKLTLRYHPLDGKVKNPLRSFYYRAISPGCGHSIFKTSFVKNYPYDERMRRFEDFDILLRMLPNAIVYSTKHPTEIHDMNYVEASKARKSIKEDCLGYLSMSGGGFWYMMCVYKLFIEEREFYKTEVRKLYPTWFWRYDMLLLMKFLNGIHKIRKS